ncbi:MAG: DEAD/DEAH box helicase, partial [Prevotellaceae bacterium]|nr:DEAD/DEAH box helicase [Prevotellaceae bacterium]
QKSIRSLFMETGELVQRIKPCFLMSPLSVSTFLDPNASRFEVVVFDEASQIFPQDAIGAIYRAEQLIVVGDSKQMPPSNFFNASVEIDDNDEETGDVTDFESILDMCSTSMQQLRLRWHYRSRYEQLITFSNKNFYDNDLVTFPSAKTDVHGIGVDYYYVDGVFDRTSHNNRKEAEFIVDLIYQNIDQYPDRSLGVVAFSVAQQNLIDRLLEKRRQSTPEKEYFFKLDNKEPFFIKNLETVQGDERDTIIFSVAYGMDSQGRLLHNFGPLNRVGGERRLNVAVTRAKHNVQLVSSMHYTDIDLNRTSAEGARLLREYLDFAENGDIALERAISISPFEQFDSDFELEVCDFLRSRGFSVCWCYISFFQKCP